MSWSTLSWILLFIITIIQFLIVLTALLSVLDLCYVLGERNPEHLFGCKFFLLQYDKVFCCPSSSYLRPRPKVCYFFMVETVGFSSYQVDNEFCLPSLNVQTDREDS